MLVIYDV